MVNEDEKYRAEVHFISEEDWAKEFNSLLDDLGAEAGRAASDFFSETEAGIALAKVRAVYPDMRKQDTSDGYVTTDYLLRVAAVQEVLGTVLKVSGATNQEFFDGLLQYIDSKPKKRAKRRMPMSPRQWSIGL